MASTRLDKLCRSVLPAGFEKISRLGPGIQQFLQQNLPEPINQQVTLLSIDDEQIVIAASSPVLTNYLRLHGPEIQQQLRETFNLEQQIKFRSIPDSLLKVNLGSQPATPKPVEVSSQSINAIERNAKWIEDEDLRAAMLSLAQSLKSD